MSIDETANAFERADAARDAANERAHQIALRRWQYPWGGLPQQPLEVPDTLAASEAAEGEKA